MLFIYFRKIDKFAKNMCNKRFYVGQGKGVARFSSPSIMCCFLQQEWCDEGVDEIERKALDCGESQEVGE